MMTSERMKRIEITALDRDIDILIEYLGKNGVLHLPPPDVGGGAGGRGERGARAVDVERRNSLEASAAALERLRSAVAWLGLRLDCPISADTKLPDDASIALERELVEKAASLRAREEALNGERDRVASALAEAKAFGNLHAPFSDLDQLSYMALRIGRIDPLRKNALAAALGDRAVVITLREDSEVLAAASRTGRFALDSELEKAGFKPMPFPSGAKGIPRELVEGLSLRLEALEREIGAVVDEKALFAAESGETLCRLEMSREMEARIGELKASLVSTRSVWVLSGWVQAAKLPALVTILDRLTEGRLAIRSFDPNEIENVRSGVEKVPVSLSHGRFVSGFERVVFSYGAPLYGTIDPTPFVALSFCVLFGLMFGDVGQGAVLFLLGLLTAGNRVKPLSRFSRFSAALKAVGVSSLLMGLLNGEVFANEKLLTGATRTVTGLLTGHPVDRILSLMPEKGSVEKLFLFFAFTLAVGVVINSVGLLINIVNQASLGRWERALFSKTGLSGALFFWYAIAFALRLALGGTPAWFDAPGFALPLFLLVFGPVFLRIAHRERPLFSGGLPIFLIESVVELLETVSNYLSNTVSFLRVGAFALSHAVLSFIVFTLQTMVSGAPFGGPVFSFLVSLSGNAIIILLEGLIVSIQVVRLQYYEFFSKFFTETGIEFSPFRFTREVKE